MNIIHTIEKIPFIEAEIFEHWGLPYMILLYLIDAYCTYRMCKKFGDPVWTSFIPFYNWIVVFRHCWNLTAFYQHFALEVSGLVIPLIIEHLIHGEVLTFIFTVIDLAVAIMAVKHAIEIGEFTLKAYGYDFHKYFWSIFIFDAVLILTLNRKYLGNKSLEHHKH